jgi:hypothetical protein
MIKTLIIALVLIALLWSVWGFFSSRVEQADYVVVKKMKGYEIREYPERIVAQTAIHDSYGESIKKGFRIVAGYIFSGNTKNENIAMTAPVMVTSEGDLLVISFGMPRSYKLETLPAPTDPRVKIVMIPVKKYAVMRFLWYRSDARIKRMQEKLFLALARDGVIAQGNTAYAGYNPPWTPPWMLRNEVLVEIK